jgi:hypothetical protein
VAVSEYKLETTFDPHVKDWHRTAKFLNPRVLYAEDENIIKGRVADLKKRCNKHVSLTDKDMESMVRAGFRAEMYHGIGTDRSDKVAIPAPHPIYYIRDPSTRKVCWPLDLQSFLDAVSHYSMC